jgi:hypothetical protein
MKGGWMAKFVERLLAMAAIWVKIQTTLIKQWPTYSSSPSFKR